jgi:hypothetical protein
VSPLANFCHDQIKNNEINNSKLTLKYIEKKLKSLPAAAAAAAINVNY